MRELTPWRPFRELEGLKREMDRLWDRLVSEGPLDFFKGEWGPSIDISETQDSILVKVEVPGMEPDDMDVSLSERKLTIKGERKQEKEEKGENFHRIEGRYGSFSRSVQLPAEINPNEVTATYKNGVLKITINKKEEAKAREIKIKVE